MGEVALEGHAAAGAIHGFNFGHAQRAGQCSRVAVAAGLLCIEFFCIQRGIQLSQAALDEASHHVLRYYGQLWTEPANLIHHGSPAKIADEIAAYDGAVDVLIVVPQIPSLDQVEQLAEHVLPAYRTAEVGAR